MVDGIVDSGGVVRWSDLLNEIQEQRGRNTKEVIVDGSIVSSCHLNTRGSFFMSFVGNSKPEQVLDA